MRRLAPLAPALSAALPRITIAAGLCAGLVLALAPAARADTYDVDYSVAPVYATAAVPGVSKVGAGLAADVEYGLTEQLWARATGIVSEHPYPLAAGGNYFAGFDAGITYSLDILRIIPFFDLGVAGIYSGGPAGKGMGLGAEIGVGFDDLESRSFSWGLEARYHFLLTGGAASTSAGTSALTAIPAYFYLGPRFTFRFPDI